MPDQKWTPKGYMSDGTADTSSARQQFNQAMQDTVKTVPLSEKGQGTFPWMMSLDKVPDKERELRFRRGGTVKPGSSTVPMPTRHGKVRQQRR